MCVLIQVSKDTTGIKNTNLIIKLVFDGNKFSRYQGTYYEVAAKFKQKTPDDIHHHNSMNTKKINNIVQKLFLFDKNHKCYIIT